MNENKKTWDEKIKLILGELEGKIKVQEAESIGQRKRRGKKYRTKQEKKRAAFRQDILLQAAKSAAFLLATVALLQGIIRVLPDSITVSNTVNGRELPIYCVETDKPQIALSFDAAWGNEDTATILEILKKHNVKVTFFMTGGWVESYPDDVKAILADGHDLGNHSENHKNMSQLSDGECEEELMSVHTKVQELTGYEMFLFRPPYGDYDNDVIKVAKKCGYYPIQWDVDSLDWKDYGVDSIIKTVTQHKHLGNGSIILCHNGAKYTAQALETLITTLQEQGYELVPISQLIYRDNYHLDHEGRQIGSL
ncbi:MAG: polysaccharide deacetylase family protein [Muribaculaceae bacterium]|nr:polysaccharide deacetylase family protein [Muribaculaceae bacterium]